MSQNLNYSNLVTVQSPGLDIFIKRALVGDELSCGLLDMIPIGISFTTDMSCQQIKHNTKASRFFRINAWTVLSHSEPKVQPLKILYNGREMLPQEMPIQRAAWCGEVIDSEELEFVWDDGIRKFGLLSACPIKDSQGVIIGSIAVCEDITERKRLEAELAAEITERQTAQQALTDAIRGLRESKERFADKIRKNSLAVVRTGEPVVAIEETAELFGKHCYWKNIKFPFRNALGQQLVGGLAFDITNQKRMEKEIRELNIGLEIKVAQRTRELQEINVKLKEEIRERQATQEALIISEARYRGLFDHLPIGIAHGRVVLDKEGHFIDNEYIDVNRAYEMDYGENLVGKRVKDIFPGIESDGKKLAEVGLTGQPVTTLETYFEKRKQWFRRRAYSLEKGHFIVISENITQHKKYEEELARLDRLDLVGEMAAGIGHEIRNPMTTVRGYLQMFQRREQFAEYLNQLDTMIEELDRANEIITEFLSLAKNKRVELKPGNLNGTIHALFPLLQAGAFRLGCEIQTDIDDIPPICYDDKEIRQLILNLVRNGLEAMDSGGILTIKTYIENDKIILAIQDNGPGIPKEVLSKIGTPFVSTKESGTGLGLSICYRVAERHKAKIEVDSSAKGTTFFIKFKALVTGY